MIPEFTPYPKMARYSRECIVTEKIDGTNACIYIGPDGEFAAASRKRWITPQDDNYGFAAWAHEHEDELRTLGPGQHFGEWWGKGIQRGYGLDERRFSLFNVSRWESVDLPPCVGVVPVLWHGQFFGLPLPYIMHNLSVTGSQAAPGFMRPEGVVIWHCAANIGLKKTLEHDDKPKGAKQ